MSASASRKAAPKVTPINAAQMDQHPARRRQTEKWLTEAKVDWQFEIVPVDSFDVETSLRNQARVAEPLNKQKVEEYRLAMERGGQEDFPALVAYMLPSGRYVIVDGNHRLNAGIGAGVKAFGTYTVDAPEDVIQILTYQANVFNGLPTSVEERLQQAVHLVDMRISIADAALRLGLSEGQVKTQVDRTKADRRAARIGIKAGWSKLPATTRQRLANVLTDEGMTEAVKVAVDAKLTGPEVSSMVSAMNGERSATGQIDVAKQHAEKYKGRIKGSAVGLPVQKGFSAFNRFLGTLTIIEGYDVQEVARTSNLAGLGPGEFTTRCMNAAELLMQIAEAAEAAEENGH